MAHELMILRPHAYNLGCDAASRAEWAKRCNAPGAGALACLHHLFGQTTETRGTGPLRSSPSRQQVSDHQTEKDATRQPAGWHDVRRDSLARLNILLMAENGREIGRNRCRRLAHSPRSGRPPCTTYRCLERQHGAHERAITDAQHTRSSPLTRRSTPSCLATATALSGTRSLSLGSTPSSWADSSPCRRKAP